MARIRGQRSAISRRRAVSSDAGSPHTYTKPPYRYDALYPSTTRCRTPAASRRSATTACIGVHRAGVPRRRSVSRDGVLPYLYDESPYCDGRLYPRTTNRRIATALGAGVRRLVVAGYSSPSQYDVSSSADTAHRRCTASRRRGTADHRTRIQLVVLVRRFVVGGYRPPYRYDGSPYACASRCRGTATRRRLTTARRRRIQLVVAGYNSPSQYDIPPSVDTDRRTATASGRPRMAIHRPPTADRFHVRRSRLPPAGRREGLARTAPVAAPPCPPSCSRKVLTG